jgi:hypothetical protein
VILPIEVKIYNIQIVCCVLTVAWETEGGQHWVKKDLG